MLFKDKMSNKKLSNFYVSNRKLSNFYVSNLLKRFFARNVHRILSQDFSQRNDIDEIMRDCILHVSLIDACYINKEYSELIQELAIDTYPNDGAL